MSKRPWISIAPPEKATGDLKRAYELIRTTRGRIPEIRGVMAGEPLALEAMAAFFPENNYACSSIDRRLSEMIATVAAVANGSRFGAPSVRAMYDVYYAKTRPAKETPASNIALRMR